MSDDEGQSGKRRKSLETRDGYEVVRPQVQIIEPQPGKRRNSLEALCSPSNIARESQRQTSHRVSIDNCALENKRRLSQDLSRDVDKINQQLSQLLFAGGKPPDLDKDKPMGGSMDTRRTRTPQSYVGGRNSIGGGSPYAGGRRSIEGGASSGSGATTTSQTMPWQCAGESTASTTLPWMSAPPVATSSDGTALPWDQGGASGSGRSVVGASHRRASVEALNRVVARSGVPTNDGGAAQRPRRNSLQAMPGAEYDYSEIVSGSGHPAAPAPETEMSLDTLLDLKDLPEAPVPPPELMGNQDMAMDPPLPNPQPQQQPNLPPPVSKSLPPSASIPDPPGSSSTKKVPWHRKIVKTFSKKDKDKMQQ